MDYIELGTGDKLRNKTIFAEYYIVEAQVFQITFMRREVNICRL